MALLLATGMAPNSNTCMLPRAVVDRVLHRLGHWESSVETPGWFEPFQQARLIPPSDPVFRLHRDAPEQTIRFQGCQPERQFWLDLLPSIDPNVARIDRFRRCGAFAFVAQDVETGRYYLRGETCKLRVCPACRRRIQRRSADRVLAFMADHPDMSWQFQTFTLKHSTDPLPAQLDRLVRCFRRLRQRRFWRDCVTTGYAVLEVTYHPAGSWSPNGRRRQRAEWHPHLHVVAATSFVDWSLLRKAWLSVTGDSDNIDCSLVESPQHAAHYIAKYIGKPPHLDLAQDRPMATEYYHALQSRRLLQPFGATGKHNVPIACPSGPSLLVCRYADLKTAAEHGSYPAQCILTHLVLATVPRLRTKRSSDPLLFPERSPP